MKKNTSKNSEDTVEEQEELRLRLTLDNCMQLPNISQNILSNCGGIISIVLAQNNVKLSFFKIP